MMLYFCCDKRRRNAVLASDLNGIDFIEVLDNNSMLGEDRQRFLHLYFLKPLVVPLSVEDFSIQGGERITDIRILSVAIQLDPHILEIEVDQAGDFSIYSLCLNREDENGNVLLTGFDPQLACVDFSFKVECPSDFDCKTEHVCSIEKPAKPPINYLAKDFASFRRLMLDRLTLIAPDWQERSVADLGVALVEILAYVGDHLSYQQDAVQTEGYFDLARHRISVKRHARLVDYHMHDGCNARAWLALEVSVDTNLDTNPDHAGHFMTAVAEMDTVIDPTSREYLEALKSKPLIFEPVVLLDNDDNARAIELLTKHNEMNFYTWSDSHCCLAVGVTQATLDGNFAQLKPQDVLIFEEVINPDTGQTKDADINHRHAVRLTVIEITNDPVTGKTITNIHWAAEDSLPFSLCISSDRFDNVSVARGNIVLCDHGQTLSSKELAVVPDSELYYLYSANDSCKPDEEVFLPPRFYPVLEHGPVTQAQPYDESSAAASVLVSNPILARPVITLSEEGESEPSWFAVRDLINSSHTDQHFVCEVTEDRKSKLRFGNDLYGKHPRSGLKLSARYRIGNGSRGNVAAEAIQHFVGINSAIDKVRNILPAVGGQDMESMESARRKAPYAYRTQERAVTANDYAEVSERLAGIQKAQATFRWTGSWHTVFLSADRDQGRDIDERFTTDLRQHVERYRMAGYDLEVDAPRFVPMELEMFVCVKPDYFRADVGQALQVLFSSQIRPDGQKGIFHPDNFTFGQTVYLSPIYAAAQSVPGVESVKVRQFKRMYSESTEALNSGRLELERLEIARLDNDPNFREHGLFRLELGGGK